ncbi:MAG: N-6 DNA methylase [Chloroflexota bacterium]|nr:N-6 DNA methylase [Chloroflexota bacterium]
MTTVTHQDRKARGAYYTPPEIAAFLGRWAINRRPAVVLDPTCGDGIFLQAAGQELRDVGAAEPDIVGIDIDNQALQQTAERLRQDDLSATLLHSSVFDIAPGMLVEGGLQADAVVGNPPFIRYHGHSGEMRSAANAAARAQGVALNGLASAWAACLVHAASFLKPGGRLAMVLPAELLTVNYAAPVRDWLRSRFGRIGIVAFRRLQFDALANVVLILADGQGGTDQAHITQVEDSSALDRIDPFGSGRDVALNSEKWSVLLLTERQASAYRRGVKAFAELEAEYGRVELGAVTGANEYFVIDEETRREFGLAEGQVQRTSPPGTRHLAGLEFTEEDWDRLRDEGRPVWLFRPDSEDQAPAVEAYKRVGERLEIPGRYKCRIRPEWWRPPTSTPPDFFFTYMSHRFPRLVANDARVTFLNSMHGLHLASGAPSFVRRALPLAMLNSLTVLGGELGGRSYGGGVLKLEPREAALLPVPSLEVLETFWAVIKDEWGYLDQQLSIGERDPVVNRVNEVLLRSTMGMSPTRVQLLQSACDAMRDGRLGMARGAR